MAVLNPVFRYSLDLTGKSPNNLISKELHTPITIDGANELLVVPTYGGFYSDTVTLRDHNYDLLARGMDYVCTYTYEDASLRTGRPVMGAIMILRPLDGDVYFGGQIVGYDYAFSTTVKKDIEAWYVAHPNTPLKEGGIVGKAQVFTDGEFRKTLWTFDGYEPTAAEMERISRELLLGDLDGLQKLATELDSENANTGDGTSAQQTKLDTHIADHNNPHKDTVPLDSRLQNWAESTSSVSADDDQSIALPETLKLVIDQVFGDQLDKHANNKNNPHGVHISQLNGYDKNTIANKFNTRLPNGATASSTSRVDGRTEPALSTDARTAYDASRFTHGILPVDTLGNGTRNSSTLLMGDGNFRDIQSIFNEYDKPAVRCFFDGPLGPDAEAIAFVRTKYQDINQYPDGSIVLWNTGGDLVLWNGNDQTQTFHQQYTRCARRNGWNWEFDYNWGSTYYATTNYRFETAGSYSFTAVKGTYSIFIVGGGGGGNGGMTKGDAGGGGGSGFATKTRLTFNTGDKVTVEVGAGGYTSSWQGGSGGATIVRVNGNEVTRASGGGGGYKATQTKTRGLKKRQTTTQSNTWGHGGDGASGGGSVNHDSYHGKHDHYLGNPGAGGTNGSNGGKDGGTDHNWEIPGGNGTGSGYYSNILRAMDTSIMHGFNPDAMGAGGSGWARDGDSNEGHIWSGGGGGGGVGQTHYGNSVTFLGNWFNNCGYGFGAGGGAAQAGIGGMASIIRIRHN